MIRRPPRSTRHDPLIPDTTLFRSEIPVCAIKTKLGRKKNFDDWPMLLRWWLAKSTLARQPRPNEVTNWYAFVANNFIYRGTWGLGSVIGLLLDKIGRAHV